MLLVKNQEGGAKRKKSKSRSRSRSRRRSPARRRKSSGRRRSPSRKRKSPKRRASKAKFFTLVNESGVPLVADKYRAQGFKDALEIILKKHIGSSLIPTTTTMLPIFLRELGSGTKIRKYIINPSGLYKYYSSPDTSMSWGSLVNLERSFAVPVLARNILDYDYGLGYGHNYNRPVINYNYPSAPAVQAPPAQNPYYQQPTLARPQHPLQQTLQRPINPLRQPSSVEKIPSSLEEAKAKLRAQQIFGNVKHNPALKWKAMTAGRS